MSEQQIKRLTVTQDGGDFYDAKTRKRIFISTVQVSDSDIESARRARQEFIEWANYRGIIVSFNWYVK